MSVAFPGGGSAREARTLTRYGDEYWAAIWPHPQTPEYSSWLEANSATFHQTPAHLHAELRQNKTKQNTPKCLAFHAAHRDGSLGWEARNGSHDILTVKTR